jgi:group I intron endonuclease
MEARWRQHRHKLAHGKHVNAALQSAWNKYGPAGIKFAVLIVCRAEDVLLFEQLAIDAFSPHYNVLKIAGRSIGWKHSDATKAGFRASRIGKKRGPMSAETKAKLRNALLGRSYGPLSDEHRARLSSLNKERMKIAEVRDHLSRLNRGKTLTEEHKKKIGKANSGKSPSEGAREKMAAAKRGTKQSEETKAKRLASYLRTVAERNRAA